jgi:hypothetical protein
MGTSCHDEKCTFVGLSWCKLTANFGNTTTDILEHDNKCNHLFGYWGF